MFVVLPQAISIPFVGVAGNLYNRINLIAAGTVLWGCMGVGMGFSRNYSEVRQIYENQQTYAQSLCNAGF